MIATLFQRLASVAEHMPDKAAVISGGATLTYGTLVQRADEFGRHLCDAGVAPGDRVAVILPNGPEFVIAAFAIWKHGAILLPLHVRFQEDELLKYVVDRSVRAIIASPRMSPVVQSIQEKAAWVAHAWLCPSDGGAWTYHGGHQSPAQARSDRARPSEPTPAWPALTQYSTGSTGFSKRVTRTHAQLISEVSAIAETLPITAADRVLGVAPFFHNYGLMNAVLASALSGATLYAMDNFFPRDVARLIEQETITGFPAVPFMCQLLAELRDPPDFSSLRYLTSAGAPLSRQTADAFRAAYRIDIRQLYGTTETGVISMAPRPAADAPDLSVGFPIPGVTVRIVDDGYHAVPDGGDGQVAVISDHAASRYDSLEGKGESHFKDGIFYPGDLGRIDATGRLVLGGRKRQFINVAGNKVDPTDVETALMGIPGVTEAVVVGVPDGAADEKIKAVLVTGAPCTRQMILDHCALKLADFKRPRVIEFRKEIPKSPLGKILRKYLIDEQDDAKAAYVFDPRSGFGAAPAGDAAGKAPCDLAAIPPFLRVLLVTDGTVTKTLEAYFWEPIEVELLLHTRMSSDQTYPAIDVKAGDAVVMRRAILRGRLTGSAYAYAETILTCDGVSADLLRSMVDGRMGIGELLRERRLETYRELVRLERQPAGECAVHLGVEPEANVMRRTYTICLERRPVIQVEERFPESRFQFLQ
ncbi:MAG: chorismate pyruvate-lyase family protein [Lentisphaerae bacterium]|nr:chorismate pyruvate-lyase family protein [Lentisphaerota bacterium]